ncbi:Oidioi.mRNA.OKI2018_I69.XSR.g15958.t1.cds [Oikopleura dioica]|uniref:Oidioi.mRNA.OKI2018_I69.XSR.g15958.t1.cds n=1 Tax=Oikopleura dioica TaxID=34765 RepID=A0ABN7SII6_OIKDI|nr:Oidioi.mRNA.OKI2018_I69.XSR.g15958.t1.cds [Oikopleura dioica]
MESTTVKSRNILPLEEFQELSERVLVCEWFRKNKKLEEPILDVTDSPELISDNIMQMLLQPTNLSSEYNGSVSHCPSIWSDTEYDKNQVPIVGTYAFFCALGIFSNLIILYVLWDEHCKNKRKSASNSFILSLCAADTIQLAILPFKIDVRLFHGCWRYGRFGCIFHNAATNINLFVSVFFLVMLSVDRFILIMPPDTMQPLKKARNHPSYVAIVTICVWSISIFLAVPSIIHSKFVNNECRLDWSASISLDSHQCSLCQTEEERKISECKLPEYTLTNETQEETWRDYCWREIDDELYKSNFCPISNHFSQYLCVLFILGYVIPLIVIIYCYTNIIMISIRAGRKTSKSITGSRRSRSKKASARDQKVTKIVLILVITFIFCWTPFHIRNMCQVWNITPGAHTWQFILDFANLGCAANSVLNPFIYSFLSTQFRQKLCMVINQKIRRPAGMDRRPTSTYLLQGD